MSGSAPFRLLIVALAIILSATPLCLRAADGDADNAAEIQRKAQEVEKLKEELNRAQSDLKRLEAENQRLRAEKTNPPPAQVAPPTNPAPAVSTLPPLAAGDMVTVRDLVQQFHADPTGAAARYAKKRFRVTGDVARFSVKFAVRYYDVVLTSPDPAVLVSCGFRYVDIYRSVYTKEKGRVLVGVVGERREIPLLKVGDTVVIEGTCRGLREGELDFEGCQVVK